MDILIRMLWQRLGRGVVIRASADDVGIVLQDIDTQLPILVKLLEEFGALSGMHINLAKTVGIPLWAKGMEEAKKEVGRVAPEWSELPVDSKGMYLGCVIGPGKKGSTSWVMR